MIGMWIVAFGLLVAADGRPAADGGKPTKPLPRFTVGKETTRVSGPLDKDGWMDYETALNERLGKGIKPETNANVLLWKALGPRPEGGKAMPPEFFHWLGIKEPPEHGEYFVRLDQFAKEHWKVRLDQRLKELRDRLTWASERPWVTQDYPLIARWLKMNEKPLALVVAATQRPEYFNPLVSRTPGGERGWLMGALLPGVQQCRELARALAARAMVHLGEGRLDQAWQDLLACHRLGRLLTRSATLVETLVGFALERIAGDAELAYLERAHLPAKQASLCLRDLQHLPPMASMPDKVDLGERFMFLDAVMIVQREGLQALSQPGDATPRKGGGPEELRAVDWDTVLRTGNRWYDRMVAALRIKDLAAREKKFRQLERELKALKEAATPWGVAQSVLGGQEVRKAVGQKIGNILVWVFMPSLYKVQQAADRMEQGRRNLYLAFALAAYRSDHGRSPQKLDVLAPGYLDEVPDDLFSGKPLIYRPSEKGYLLYSVGINGRDEGGRSYDDEPPGDDLCIRMPLPPLKRK